MAKTLEQNIAQAVSDFKAIKDAIVELGIDVPAGTPTRMYANKILQLPINYENVDWAEVKAIVQAGDGPTAFPIGSQFKVQHNQYGEVVFDVVAHNIAQKADDPIAPTMTLLCHDPVFKAAFDNQEAFYYAEQELPVGTYNFTLNETLDKWIAGTYQFTLTTPLPAGGPPGPSGPC